MIPNLIVNRNFGVNWEEKFVINANIFVPKNSIKFKKIKNRLKVKNIYLFCPTLLCEWYLLNIQMVAFLTSYYTALINLIGSLIYLINYNNI